MESSASGLLQKNPKARFHRVALVLLVLALLVVAGGFLIVQRLQPPRYLGKAALEWFPEIPIGGVGMTDPPEALTRGDPEALPMLVAATWDEKEWTRTLIRIFPTRLIAALVRRWIGPNLSMRQYHATRALCLSASSPLFAEALADRLDELPTAVQLDLEWIPEPHSRALIESRLRPLLEETLRTGRFEDRLAVGFRLMRYPSLSDETLRNLFWVAEEMLDPEAPPTRQLQNFRGFLLRAGALGPVSEDVTSRLRRQLPRLSRKARLELRMALTRLNPTAFPVSGLLADAGNPDEAFAQFEAACTVLKLAADEGLPAENLRPILELCLRFYGQAEQSDAIARDKASVLIRYANRSFLELEAPWLETFALGLDDPRKAVRHASAGTLYQLKVSTPSVLDRVVRLLEQGREPELSLRILTGAGLIPARVEMLVRTMAAGEIPKEWVPEPEFDGNLGEAASSISRSETLQQLAQSLLNRVRRTPSDRL